MTRREKLQGAAFILILLAATVADASMIAAAILIAVGGVLVYISGRCRR